MRIAITGAAGLVGRTLLFEIIKQNIDRLRTLEVFILGRGNAGQSIDKRIHDILLEDGAAYLSLGREDLGILKQFCLSGLTCLETDLSREDLGMKPADLKKLRAAPIDFFFHVAALTDLRTSSEVAAALEKNNVLGTRRLLNLASSLQIGEFCYVGTAYACGTTTGLIKPDYIQPEQPFRNPYERSKLRAEMLVRDFARRTGIRCRYFRPSIICGRLIEPPLGSMHKFDVFYASAAALLRLKLKVLKCWMDKYHTPAKLDLRICCSPVGGLNIVPADFVVKAMYQVCRQNDPGESYHLVNDEPTPNDVFIAAVLESLNISGIKIVDRLPERMNSLELLYYRTVGMMYTPYIASEPMLFDTSSLVPVLRRAKLSCPPADRDNLLILMDFAKKCDFGLTIRT